MAENAAESISSQFVGIEPQGFGRRRLAEPLHVVLDEDLDHLAADASSTLQASPGTAADRHVRTKFHQNDRASRSRTHRICAPDWGRFAGPEIQKLEENGLAKRSTTTFPPRTIHAPLCRRVRGDWRLPYPSIPDPSGS